MMVNSQIYLKALEIQEKNEFQNLRDYVILQQDSASCHMVKSVKALLCKKQHYGFGLAW